MAAVVAEEDEDGVVGEAFFLKDFAHAADGGVDGFDAAVVVGQLRLPGAGVRLEIFRRGAVQVALGEALGRDGLVHVVLLVGLELRDEEEEWLVVLLAEEALGAVGEEVDAVLVLVLDGLLVAIPDGAVVGMRCVLDGVGAFPQIEKAAAVFGLDGAGAAAVCLALGGEMPLADEVASVAGLAQLAGECGQGVVEAEAVVPDSGFGGVTAGEEDRT